jgi:hypothetical protein
MTRKLKKRRNKKGRRRKSKERWRRRRGRICRRSTVEEKGNKEAEDNDKNEEPTKLPHTTKNGLDISMEIKMEESSIEESGDAVYDFIDQ